MDGWVSMMTWIVVNWLNLWNLHKKLKDSNVSANDSATTIRNKPWNSNCQVHQHENPSRWYVVTIQNKNKRDETLWCTTMILPDQPFNGCNDQHRCKHELASGVESSGSIIKKQTKWERDGWNKWMKLTGWKSAWMIKNEWAVQWKAIMGWALEWGLWWHCASVWGQILSQQTWRWEEIGQGQGEVWVDRWILARKWLLALRKGEHEVRGGVESGNGRTWEYQHIPNRWKWGYGLTKTLSWNTTCGFSQENLEIPSLLMHWGPCLLYRYVTVIGMHKSGALNIDPSPYNDYQ